VDFKELVRMARRRWKTIVAMFVLGLVGSAVISFTTTPTYHSTARVFVSTDVSSSAEQFYAGAFTTARVKSYADLATSRELMNRVIDRLNLQLTPAQLASKITATVAQDTVIIQLETRDKNAQAAQTLAQAEAEELSKYLTEVDKPSGGGDSVKATVVDPAAYDARPVAPRTAVNLAVAGLLGLLLGIGLAVARDVLDNTVSSTDDIERILDRPVLTSVGFDSDVPKHPLISDPGAQASRVEAFRRLRTNLQVLNLDHTPRSIVITSPLPGEGKTSTAVNIAIALAQAGQRVLLVDGDLRRPKAASVLGLERSVGFTTVLVGRAQLEESIQRHSRSGIFFLASGPIPPNPTEVLQSNAARSLFDRLSQMFDIVIVDAPPLLPVSDAAIIARDVDGAVLVVRHGKTTKDQLRQASHRLDQVDARLLGVTVNMTPKRGGSGYGYGYGYEYEYAYTPQRRELSS
jgi:receptor protein-tyrosine kinase